MRKAKFKEDDRVSFMAKTCGVDNGVAFDTIRHFVGYIKQVRRGKFRTRYAICVAKSDEMFIVNEKDIFRIAEKKENKQSNKTNENGNI